MEYILLGIVGLCVLSGMIILWFYINDKYIYPMSGDCDGCMRRYRWDKLNCFTMDYRDWKPGGQITLEEAIEQNMFKGYSDRNWEAYTDVFCDYCLKTKAFDGFDILNDRNQKGKS